MGSIRSADIVRLLASWFLSFLALLITADLLPGFTSTPRGHPCSPPGLSQHPGGIGFVTAMAIDGPVAIGCGGRHHLATGVVEGTDPLAPFGGRAPAMVFALTSMPEAPDLYVNSALDEGTQEVAAFEPLVGCHGGLGGWQDRAFVLAPPELLSPSEPIVGGDHLHQHLVGILDSLGHRTHLTRTSR